MSHQQSKIRLHLGGWEPKEGWTIVNIENRAGVDVIGSCTDLSMFADGSVSEIYASHVYEHLGYQSELPMAFSEAKRVLEPNGYLRISVPDLEILCNMFLHYRTQVNQQFYIQRMMMGGQMDEFDFHKTGFSQNILIALLNDHKFHAYKRVESFGLFKDTSELRFGGVSISLILECRRAPV